MSEAKAAADPGLAHNRTPKSVKSPCDSARAAAAVSGPPQPEPSAEAASRRPRPEPQPHREHSPAYRTGPPATAPPKRSLAGESIGLFGTTARERSDKYAPPGPIRPLPGTSDEG